MPRSSKALLWQKMMVLSPLCSGSIHEQYVPCGKTHRRCKDSQHPNTGRQTTIGWHGLDLYPYFAYLNYSKKSIFEIEVLINGPFKR